MPVVLERCSDYASVSQAIDRALVPLGGMQAFVRPGQSVLIKPNLLTDAAPEKAVTTHPDVVRAVIRAVRAAGGDCCVGDSPASVAKLERVWQKTGMRTVCDEEQVPLVAMEQAGAQAHHDAGMRFDLARVATEADVIINLPKLKTHTLTGLTCAVKNLYGCVPGMHKLQLHKQYWNMRDFGRIVAAIYQRVTPGLNVVDAVTGMDGNGPSSGRARDFGFVAASGDAVDLDVVMCEILGLRADKVPYLEHLMRHGMDDIRLAGTSLDALRPSHVDLPNTWGARLIPTWLTRLVGPLWWCRPSFGDRCVYCGLCVKSCPGEALTQHKGSKPVLDPKRCIECCCCHEICPHDAINMQLAPLFRMIQRFSKAPK